MHALLLAIGSGFGSAVAAGAASAAADAASGSVGSAGAAAPPAWRVAPESFCGLNHTVNWGGTFDACLAQCVATKCTEFAFTNKNWAGRTGCVVQKDHCASPCDVKADAACKNWDTYTCSLADDSCAKPPPPAPPPPPPARFAVSPALGSHMVLQRDTPARVWGTAKPGSAVSLAVSGPLAEKATATASAAGEWQIDLKVRPAQAEPSTLTFSTPGAAAITLDDVLFGDVWGCHGQSNMAFGLGQDINASLECPATAAFPNIRLTTFSSHLPWQRASPAVACSGKGFSPFSAVCWYFGKDVYLSQGGKVPIGLVSSNVGGTAVERWSGADALAKCNQTGVVQQSNLWTPWIVPLLPMAVSGWTWYQAESNVACSTSWRWMPGLNCGIGCTAAQPVCNASIQGCADFYACQFPAMIEDWKAKWNGGSGTNGGRPKPFLFVELAPYTEGAGEPHDTSVSAVRQAQMAALKLPLVGMAAAYDYGDVKSPLGNIHPEYKAPVGLRLSLAARALAYGEKELEYRNPTLVSSTAKSGKIELTFSTKVELRTPPNGGCVSSLRPDQCAWMTVNGQNASFSTTADGTIAVDGASGAVVRYLQGDWPVPTIYAAGSGMPGLPAAPFIATAG